MIFNLRGTTGSGKSTVGRRLVTDHMAKGLLEPGFGRKRRVPCVYQAPSQPGADPLFIVGRYHSDHGGGIDGIHMSEAEPMIRYWAERGHVFFEGLMVSASGKTGRWVRLARELTDQSFVWAYLDTSLEMCIARVYQRNGGKPIKEPAVKLHHRQVARSANALREIGVGQVVDIDHENAYSQVHAMLEVAGWKHEDLSGCHRG